MQIIFCRLMINYQDLVAGDKVDERNSTDKNALIEFKLIFFDNMRQLFLSGFFRKDRRYMWTFRKYYSE